MAENHPPAEQAMSRRGFVGWAVGLGAAFIALVGAIPLKASLLTSAGTAKAGPFVKVADVATIGSGGPVALTFVEPTTDAYNFTVVPHSVYVIKNSATDITVLSPICPHLGCPVYFDRAADQFTCPCHGSVFAANGSRISGPTPRGLDTLPSKVVNGALLVQWVQYRSGVTEKTPV